MVGWGMGHNLEKNLRKIESLREKGQLDRALKQLQEWARKHPDTPHYLFEAAMAAFDLRDWGTGIAALRSLLRNLPETREKVIGACAERFEETPSVPLAEFLVEASLADGDYDQAVARIAQLETGDQAMYARKASMRHESALATPQTPESTLRNSHLLQVLIGCALGDGSPVTPSIEALLVDPELVERIEPLLLASADAHPMDDGLRTSHARCLLALDRIGDGSEEMVEAARRAPDQRASAIEILAAVECDDDQRGRWLRARGDLALLADDGAAAAQLYLESADADASLRDSLLDRLETAGERTDLPGREEILKLRLRLLVVQKRYDQVSELSQQLIDEGFAEAQEMRALLGEGQAEQTPSEMLVVWAETALHDRDLAAAAEHVGEIPNEDIDSLSRIAKKITLLLEDWPADTKLQLEALHVLLLARMQRREDANKALAAAWAGHPDAIDTLAAVTERCMALVEPLPFTLRSALAQCADAGKARAAEPLLRALLPEASDSSPAGSDSGSPLGFGEPSNFDQDALTLDFGGSEPSSGGDLGEIEAVLVDLIEERSERGPQILELLDHVVTAPSQQRQLRHAFALAALWSERFDRALGEFAVLTMMADPALLERVGEQFDQALERFGDDADLLVARADLLADSGQHRKTVDLLARALAADPKRAESLIERFDALLPKVDESEAPELWRALAEALFAVQRFDRLEELCSRAEKELEDSEQATFVVLRARMWLAQGRFSETLQVVQQHLVAGRLPAPKAVELLEGAVNANPSSPVALLMLGQAATRAGNLPRAFEAYVAAIARDPSLEAPVADQIHQIVTTQGSDPELLIRIACFHRDRGDHTRAASTATQALQLEPELADRVLGELSSQLAGETVDASLLAVAARAARLSGQCALSCEHLARLHATDPHMLETVLAEYRQLRERFDDDLRPVEGLVEVLLEQRSSEPAVEVLVDAAGDDRYDLEGRIALVGRVRERLPRDQRLSLCLAELLASAGRTRASYELVTALAAEPNVEVTALARVTEAMLLRDTENAALRLLHHDLLMRAGRPLDALATLPVPASLAPEQQSELSDRLSAREDLVLVDERLTLSLASSLWAQDRADEAFEVFERATRKASYSSASPIWREWARMLHECDRDEDARDLLLAHAGDEDDRRAAYQSYARWRDERRARELEALRQRHEDAPDDPVVAIELAVRLLEDDAADEASILLRELDGEEHRVERALLLGRAHLQMARADLAEAVMLDAIALADRGSEEHAAMQWHLAECAARLGRPAEATARLQSLLSDPKYQAVARTKARSVYARTLNEVAGEDRAALTALSSL